MRFEILGSVVFSEIRASTVDSNVEEKERERIKDDAEKTTQGHRAEGDIWRFMVRDARETIFFSTLGKSCAPNISVAKPPRSRVRDSWSLLSHAETVEHLTNVRAHLPKI